MSVKIFRLNNVSHKTIYSKGIARQLTTAGQRGIPVAPSIENQKPAVCLLQLTHHLKQAQPLPSSHEHVTTRKGVKAYQHQPLNVQRCEQLPQQSHAARLMLRRQCKQKAEYLLFVTPAREPLFLAHS